MLRCPVCERTFSKENGVSKVSVFVWIDVQGREREKKVEKYYCCEEHKIFDTYKDEESKPLTKAVREVS